MRSIAAASLANARLESAIAMVGQPGAPALPVITRPMVQAEGGTLDPYRFISSRGRNGAGRRAARMAAAMPKRTPSGRTNPKAKDLLARLAREAKRRGV